MNFKIARRVLILIAFFLTGIPFSFAQNNSILSLAEQYSRALKQVERSKNRRSLEKLFLKGMAMSEKLDEMENLSESDYALLEKKMRGFVINRDETVYVKSDNDFYKNLAQKRGTLADAAFFKLSAEFRPNNVWIAFIQQQTDYSGCTVYGDGIFTRIYGKFNNFKKQFPKAYRSQVSEMLDEIESELKRDTCACADQNSVTKEYGLFIKTFPKDKIVPFLRKRLKEIENKKSNFRFNCRSG